MLVTQPALTNEPHRIKSMAHLPPELLPAGAGFSKTLFLAAGSAAAVLVQRRGKKMSERPMQFADAHAALTWCEQNGAGFYWFPAADPGRN